MDNNSSENLRENSENNGNNDFSTAKNNFLNDFYKNYSNNANLLDDIFNGGEISGNLKDRLENEFEKGKTKGGKIKGKYNVASKNEYLGINIDDIKKSDLQNKFGSDYIYLKEKRKALEGLFLDEFDLEDIQKEELKNGIQNIEFNKLSDFIGSNKKRNIFIKSILGNDIDKFQIDNFPSLYSISKTEYKKKIKLLNTSDANIIKNIFLGFKNGILDEVGIKELIRIDFLNDTQKKEIVEKLIPNISLKKIEEFNLVSADKISELKNKIKTKYKNKFSDLTDFDLEYIYSNLDFDNIFIKTSSIISDVNISEISDKIGFSSVEKDFEKFKDEVEKNHEKEGPKDFKSFKKELTKLGISGVDKLIEGKSVLRFTKEGKDLFKQNYLKFDKLNEDNKKLSLNMVGSKNNKEGKTKIDLNGEEKNNYSYSQLIKMLRNENDDNKVSLDILSDEDFKSIIKDTDNFDVEIEGFKRISKDELDEDDELKNKIKEELEEKYRSELEELEKELSDLQKEINSVKNDNTLDLNEKESKLDSLFKKETQLLLRIKDKESELGDVENDNVSTDVLVAHKNFNDLVDKINSLDSNGTKLGLKKGIILETKNGSYEITGISKQLEFDGEEYTGENITINSISGEETMSYEAFFNAFKENKTKRIEKLNTFDDLLKDNSWDEDYEIQNDCLIQKEVDFNGKKGPKNIEYLVSERGQLIKLESIGNGRVDVVFGEYSEGKKNKETKITKNKISLETNSTNLSINELNKFIKDKKFVPDWKIGKDYTIENIDGYKNDLKGSFMTRFWNRTSFKELYMSGTLLVDGIQEYFKKGNDIKAAEFALKFGSVLPSEIYEDLVAQTEMKGDEAMDKELTALGKIASGKAFMRVKGWLLNKDTPPHKIEAGLMLAAKYGVLYPKKLADYNGTFLWYEALGGKIGDEMYEEEKLKAEKKGLPFDEKELLISLLGAQSGGRLNPKRRSKFYKKFKGAIAGGFSEEYGDGYKDAEDKRNTGDVVDGGMDEAIDGTLPNALGWAKKAVEKGGTLKEMNEIYFSLIFSGALLNAPGKVLEELKNHWSGEGNSMILAAFGSDLGGQKIFNKTIVNLSKDMEDLEPSKYEGMYEMANSIFNKSSDYKEGYSDKVKAAREFWNIYGNGLSRALYMADGTTDDLEYSKTDKLIAFGKDDKYKDYYNFSKVWGTQSSAFKKDFMKDEVGGSGATGIDHFNIVKQHFKFTASQTFADIDTISVIWPKIWGDILAIKEKIEIDPANAYKYKKYLKNKLREISAGLLSTLGKRLYDSLAASDPAGKDLMSIGIDLSKFKENSYEDVLNGNDGMDTIFDDAVKNVVSGNISGNGNIDKTFLNITEDVKENVNDMMYNPYEDENVA